MEVSSEQLPCPLGNTGHGGEEETVRNGSYDTISSLLPEEYENSHVMQPASARPVLPAFWGNTQESPHVASGDGTTDVWRELNSESPSILRLQCLWAYFNLPALSLADSVSGLASVAAQTDGFRSVVQVSSPLLHAPHVESVKDIYFAKETLALVFTGIQLAVDLRGAGEAFEKAVCLRDQHMIPSLLLVRNVPAVRIESDGGLGPYGYVTVRKHKAFRWIVSLAPSDARVYDVFEMTDGFELGENSGLFVIGSWIVDLRTFSALRMLFRSEVRNSRTVQPEYLLEAAMEVFGVTYGHQEGDEILEYGQRQDEVTGSTAIPMDSEGTPERESPSSLPQGEHMDDDEDHKSPRIATLHMMGSPVEHNSCLLGEQQQHLKEADYIISSAQSEVNELAQSKGHAFQCHGGSDPQQQQHMLVADTPSTGGSGNPGVKNLTQEGESCPTEKLQDSVETRDYERQCSTENAQEGTCSDSHQSGPHFEQPGDTPSVAINGVTSSRLDEQQLAETIHDGKATSATSNETSHMFLNSTTSDGDHDVGEQLVDQLEDQNFPDAADIAHANTVESCPVARSNIVTAAAYDAAIEKKLQHWISTNVEVQSYEEPNAVFERSYPSHEFEYWAVEDILVTVEQNYESDEPGTLSVNCGDEVFLFSVTNTSWAFCRTKGGELGYVPTVAVPDAFRKMFKHTKMYARKTATVDRYCKWKGTILHPGDPIVILAELGKWVLVRDYSRPFREGFIHRGRIQQ